MKRKEMCKKLLSIGIASIMTVGMLMGCSNANKTEVVTEKEETTSESINTEKQESTQVASGEKTVISLYRESFNIANPDSAEVTAIQDAINEYIADKINVEIKLTDIGSGEYADKTNLALSNGEINMLFTASWLVPIQCDNLYTQNAVYDITDLLQGSALYDSVPSFVWDSSAYHGKNYFVPCYKESAEGYDIIFRKDLLDKYGWNISSVKTLKDLETMLEDCKNEGLKYPYLTQKTAMFYRLYLNDFDAVQQDNLFAIDRATDKVVNVVQTPQYKEFTTLMCEWAEKGYLSEDDVTKTTNDTTTQTKDWGITWWTDIPNNGEANLRFKQDTVTQPFTQKFAHSTTTLGSCFAITSNSTQEQAKACIDFLGLLYTDKTLADLYTFGIEGVDYDRDQDGFITKKGEMYDHSAWESGSVLHLSLEAGEPENKVDLYTNFNNSSVTSCAAGFRFDKTSVEAQYQACISLFDEYGFVLENGGYASSEVEDIIAEYQQELDDAGYQDVLAELTKQYEEWKAAK